MIPLPLRKQIYMEDGYMLSNVISLLVVLIMMFSLCYVSYKSQEHKYYMMSKGLEKKNRKNKKGNKNDK